MCEWYIFFFDNCKEIYYPQQEAAKMVIELRSTWSRAWHKVQMGPQYIVSASKITTNLSGLKDHLIWLHHQPQRDHRLLAKQEKKHVLPSEPICPWSPSLKRSAAGRGTEAKDWPLAPDIECRHARDWSSAQATGSWPPEQWNPTLHSTQDHRRNLIGLTTGSMAAGGRRPAVWRHGERGRSSWVAAVNPNHGTWRSPRTKSGEGPRFIFLRKKKDTSRRDWTVDEGHERGSVGSGGSARSVPLRLSLASNFHRQSSDLILAFY